MLEIKDDGLYLNGKKFKIYSGAIHYFRILPQYWNDRLSKLKSAGFNTVETYMCWNLHESQEGQFNFDGMLDIVKYCKTAQSLGLNVILRPGPYICSEWDFGGLPAWLLKDKNIEYRCNNSVFMSKVEAYFKEVFKRVAPLEVQNGGNIIAVQIENEYGSYGNDKSYLCALENLMRNCGAKVPFFTSDGDWCNMLSGGTLPHIFKTLNFGSNSVTAFNALKNIQPKLPKVCMEFWCGWFDH
ncbi:MAG: beta-galactosidase, partial [Clostridia bacterium]